MQQIWYNEEIYNETNTHQEAEYIYRKKITTFSILFCKQKCSCKNITKIKPRYLSMSNDGVRSNHGHLTSRASVLGYGLARHHKWLAIGNRASVNVEPWRGTLQYFQHTKNTKKTLNMVATRSWKPNSMIFPWFFHDECNFFHDVLRSETASEASFIQLGVRGAL